MKEIRTLCNDCRSTYYDAGYKLRRIKKQKYKEPCEICKRFGWDYVIVMGCGHQWKKVNDVFVCVRCGITRLPNGKIYFDRKLPNVKVKK